jgi:ElaB/YqjD/DUF883 family membrane-anchored ribosome-binding protein
MDTVLAESKIEKTNKAQASCGGACLGSEIKEAAKRVEKGLNDSKEAVSAKLEDGRIAAKRFLKHSRYAAEDGIEEIAHQIKRHPLSSLAIAFATGAALGFLAPHVGKNSQKTNPGD